MLERSISKGALLVLAVIIVALAIPELKNFFSAPLITLEQSQEYARELSGDPAHPPIIIFYASWCPACKVTREFMDKEKIPYVPAEIEENLAAQHFFNQLTKGKGSPIPVTVIGETVIIGYKPWSIIKAVESLPTT